MTQEFEAFFKTESVPKVNHPPTPDDIVHALTVFEEDHGPHKILKPPVPRKRKETEPVRVVSLSRITEAMRTKNKDIPLFPNAAQLGKETEQVVYALLLGTFLTQQNVWLPEESRESLRRRSFELFDNAHRKKAFAVADLVYREREAFADCNTPKVPRLFSRVHGAGEFQLGMPLFDAVLFHPDQTAKDLSRWETVMTATAEDALSLQFEVTVSAFCQNRIIVHPFDAVVVDSSGAVHLIEISNRRNASYTDNPARLVEDALLELVADRIRDGSCEVDLLSPPRRVGFGEVWTVRDEPGSNNCATRVHLSDKETEQALEIMMHITL